MTRTRFASTLALGTLLLVGCGSSAQSLEAQNGGDGLTGSDQRGRRAGAGNDGDLASRGGDCRTEAVYFAYDSSELDARARSAIESNANCVQRRTGQAAVTGMTDPRGTEEYNMMLGERRADAAKKYLERKGVPAERMTTRSYGKENPAVEGSNERAWKKNRRPRTVMTSLSLVAATPGQQRRSLRRGWVVESL